MIDALKTPRFNYLCLGAGSISYIIFAILQMLSFSGSDQAFAYPIMGLLYAIFFVGYLFYFQNLADKIEMYNVEQLIKYALVLQLLPAIIGTVFKFLISPSHSGWLEVFLDSLFHVIMTISFIVTLSLFKKLILFKKEPSAKLIWRIFIGGLVLSALFSLNSLFNIPTLIVTIVYIIITILSALLSYNIKWIAFLNYKSKWICLALFLALKLLLILNAYYLFKIDHVNAFKVSSFVYESAIIFSGVFVAIYASTSFFGILFNIPIAKVLDDRETEFNSIQQMQEIIGDDINKKEIFEKLLNISLNNTKSIAGWVANSRKEKNIKFFNKRNITDDTLFPIDGIINVLTSTSKYYDQIYVPNIQKDDSFMHVDEQYKSFVFFPIVYQNKLIGKMVLLKNSVNGFDEYMIRLVKTYIEQTVLALSKVELIQTAIDSAKMREELDIARNVQKKLLPEQMPLTESFEIAAHSEPASEVGGDYYDYYQINDHQYAVVIGDVSGKGTSAAFHMAEMKGIFQALVQLDPDPKSFIAKANSAIHKCFEKGVFITLVYLLIDTRKKEVLYSRAGHCPILHYSNADKTLGYLKDEGMGLGILSNALYEPHIEVYKMTFAEGDIIVMYTDGFIEARSSKSNNTKEIDQYGYDKLKEVVAKTLHLSALEIKNALIDDVNEYQKDVGSFDDNTLVVVRFK